MSTTLIRKFIDACWCGDVETAERMIEDGFVPVPEHEGEPSPLLIAIEEEKLDMANVILRGNVDVNYSDDMGTTALQAAVCIGNQGLVFMLISRGAKNKKDFTGRSASDYARLNGFEDIAKIIEGCAKAC